MDFRAFALILASLVTMPATDIYLPSLPGMAEYFGVSASSIKDSIALYQVGSFVSALLLGFLSDRFGRKAMLLVGLAIFHLGCHLCTLTGTFEIFMIGRFLQGAGEVSTSVIGWAMVYDVYSKERAAKLMSILGACYASIPLFSPTLGGYIDVHWGWQANFRLLGALSGFTFLLFLWKLKDTPFQRTSGPLNLTSYWKTSLAVLENKRFLGYVLIFASLLFGEWCYLALIPFYLEKTLFLGPETCGFIISALGVSYIIGAYACPKLITAIGLTRTISLSLKIVITGAVLFLISTYDMQKLQILGALGVAIFLLGLAMTWAPSTAKALEGFRENRGSASSIRSLIFKTSSAMGSFLASFMTGVSLFPLSVLFLFCAVLSTLIFYRLTSSENTAS